MSFGTSRTWIIRHYLESSDDVVRTHWKQVLGGKHDC